MKANITKSTFRVLALTCSLILLSPAQAANKDLEQEITIKSQRQAADLKNKIASYLGNVSIRQGSISITADIVKVFSLIDKKTGIKSDTYLAKGKPAIFQQMLDDGSLISLQADEITYNPNSNNITISGNALVKQAGSEVSGDIITYNTLTEQLEAQSADNRPVTTVLQPTILKNQKETHEKSKEKKPTEANSKTTIKKDGDNSDL
ncbi:lipopolysaccharide transport periplasmic protein LptA [Colwellia piezophila]|uniref:lipopolysaccharide transport periplasmic protein LptA n=1 Tax=Colwellia piezophila TaxID=211668 RepID=UPI000364E8CB|nr:lipopolysaccharide transport periplasmic protein LptA [Colwellia piezophila]